MLHPSPPGADLAYKQERISTAAGALVASTLVLVLLGSSVRAAAQSARNVLVVVNANHAQSVEIGDYYAAARGVPAEQVLKLDLRFARPTPGLSPEAQDVTAVPDEISRLDYERQIEAPVGQWLRRNAAQDRILYIVLTKGIPLRVTGTSGRAGTQASVDSELTVLYRRMTGRPQAPGGSIENPYFLGEAMPATAARFTHEEHDIYLVTRLDGFTVADVKALVDRGLAPRNEGRYILDMKAPLTEAGNAWLAAAAERLTALGLGDRVVLDRTSEGVRGEEPVLGYFSWGSADPTARRRSTGFVFVPGAIAGSFVSTDARTFAEPPKGWPLGTWERRESWFAGSPQSLTGDLVRDGVTGAAGNVAEPFLDRSVRPQVLFAAYVAGFNLAEAFYLAMPALSWQAVVVGDPLCAIVQRDGPDATSLEPELDPDTELPRFFAQRRLEAAQSDAKAALLRAQTGAEPTTRQPRYPEKASGDADIKEIDSRALRLAIRGESRLVRGDRPGAREALEEATALEPRLTGSLVILASLAEQDGDYSSAVRHYRRVLETSPDNVVALNNLAFLVATQEKSPAEALPLAERAYALARGAATVADTLGWVQHLVGNHEEAFAKLDAAVRALPRHAEMRYHMAAVALAVGDRARAQRELSEALRLDPSLREREEVKALEHTLQGRR